MLSICIFRGHWNRNQWLMTGSWKFDLYHIQSYLAHEVVLLRGRGGRREVQSCTWSHTSNLKSNTNHTFLPKLQQIAGRNHKQFSLSCVKGGKSSASSGQLASMHNLADAWMSFLLQMPFSTRPTHVVTAEFPRLLGNTHTGECQLSFPLSTNQGTFRFRVRDLVFQYKICPGFYME